MHLQQTATRVPKQPLGRNNLRQAKQVPTQTKTPLHLPNSGLRPPMPPHFLVISHTLSRTCVNLSRFLGSSVRCTSFIRESSWVDRCCCRSEGCAASKWVLRSGRATSEISRRLSNGRLRAHRLEHSSCAWRSGNATPKKLSSSFTSFGALHLQVDSFTVELKNNHVSTFC